MEISEEKNDIKEAQKTNANLKKDDLIVYIKEWIKIDNEIINLKTQVKQKTIKKKELTESLVNVMKCNNIDCFDINGGALIYKQKKTKRTISGKFLLTVKIKGALVRVCTSSPSIKRSVLAIWFVDITTAMT